MNKCYLSLGSNLNGPERQIRQALEAIKGIPHTSITKISSFYKTKPWGNLRQQDFCNTAVEILTRLTPLQLLKYCNAIEKKQGRTRYKHWGPRTLDIDIIFYGSRRIKTSKLIIPHPHWLERDFVIVPLKELGL